ncbi:hypothetical protein R69927_03049 [Paraburkholderia domus]|uniref:DUF4148 domain-containing protein n=1 Tax=Paraburkholderia domus TaxID=2793075 RepID=A0A9N8R038_9BURK|nr:hypothetical protein [Paraburkholderia domus]MBK5049622.1 hypothetical protein [Burkholderia sp. R-70006]MBK5059798.1 hypothetical protein [Burkholderia sp. R-70199]MBK5121762.1 hypothetical protein [Burkholderia sp. R-69980]MBK5167260.1 hypothetical protein [Burkholderia sp. R-70211]MBK5180961.1 hypothetical protein [Burkholderia sp. R-69749]MCI0145820.1 hypothetical protein [Paraburkholderia sediminicola]
MQRFLLVVAATVLPGSAPAQENRDYYRENGTTLPRALSSDPVKPNESSVTKGFGITAPGSNVNMSNQARRDLDARLQSERAEREAREQARREPPLKFNIPAPEMPKPNTAK